MNEKLDIELKEKLAHLKACVSEMQAYDYLKLYNKVLESLWMDGEITLQEMQDRTIPLY
jgi:hypothetical protein